MSQENQSSHQDKPNQGGIKRRDILKGLAAVPVLGYFVYRFLDKKSLDHKKKQVLLEDLLIPPSFPY